ncbi:vasodilator-stimulated phosphoprotein-like isoform X2 [Elephas maximus indicus]|uniref:vasodilator-stimulated phosphoprotein-like isoform X2 n=1 Tax=Elephas maximus indicus TaxID=99487 RepID=UPI002116FDCB|nr:vasodilator-stimulated phosphoprotein-like isoform X2 [Elephas maximus indicus]
MSLPGSRRCATRSSRHPEGGRAASEEARRERSVGPGRSYSGRHVAKHAPAAAGILPAASPDGGLSPGSPQPPPPRRPRRGLHLLGGFRPGSGRGHLPQTARASPKHLPFQPGAGEGLGGSVASARLTPKQVKASP